MNRLKENYLDVVEQCNENINSMTKTKELFDEKFFSKFGAYCKKISDQHDKEKEELAKLVERKTESSAKIKMLENKLFKLNDKILQYFEYKLFLTNIKEHRNVYDLNSNCTENKDDQNANEDFSKLMDPDSKTKLIMPPIIVTDKVREKLMTDNTIIFSSPEEIVEELRKLEYENLSRLDRYNTVVKNLILIQDEVEIYKNNYEKDIDYIFKELDQKKSFVQRQRERNTYLTKEKNLILNPPGQNVKKSIKIEKLEASHGDKMEALKSKIFSLYQNCFFFYTKKFSLDPTDTDSIKNRAILKSNDITEYIPDMLIFNEKVFTILHKKFLEIQATNQSKLAFLEKELEKRRQLKNSIIQKDIYLEKIKEIKEKLAKKNESIILPIRKIKVRLKPAEKVRSNSMSVQFKENKYIDFLKPLY